MRRRSIPYSAAELAFIEARKTTSRVVLHAAFVKTFRREDVTVDHIKSLCTRNGWTTRERWSDDDDALLRERYPDTPTEQVATLLGRSLTSTYQRSKTLGLRKSEAYLASPAACRLRRGDNVGASHRFAKGHVPANKGKPMPFHPNSAATRFKKGERRGVAVRLWKPIGTERLSKDGYLERKINNDWPLQARWRAVHLVRWEEVNGPLPKGMALKNLDGNRQNTDPSNWDLIDRALLPRLNGGRARRLGYDEAPAELKPTIMALAKLEHATRKRKCR